MRPTHEGFLDAMVRTPEPTQKILMALQQLVTLKALKDDQGKCESYLAMQPQAWEDARTALTEFYESLDHG